MGGAHLDPMLLATTDGLTGVEERRQRRRRVAAVLLWEIRTLDQQSVVLLTCDGGHSRNGSDWDDSHPRLELLALELPDGEVYGRNGGIQRLRQSADDKLVPLPSSTGAERLILRHTVAA